MTVLDASALLAFLQNEPGSETVEAALLESAISSVNWAEVMQKALAGKVDTRGMREELEALGLHILPFTPEDAELAAQLWQPTRHLGLSLGDRACLSVGIRLKATVLTADHVWTEAQLPVSVRSIR